MRILSLFSLLLFFGLVSCTREESFEVGASARGSLQSNTTGECLSKIVAGSFVAGNALSDSNYLEVDVDVVTLGAYTIKTTDTVNGYSFSGSGNFTKTGINRIRLTGSGTPLAEGEDLFTVLFDTSFCFVPVTVLPAGSSTSPAVFTLQGWGDSCMDASVAGNYVQSTALNGTNTVAVKINVTTPGTYTITTNTVNGFFFSGTGALASTGEQIITLAASGTPNTGGSAVFTVTTESGSCAFSVNVTEGTSVGTGDLFPLSLNSWWSYVPDVTAPEDSFTVISVGSITLGTQTYQILQFKDRHDMPYDSAFFRRNGAEYLRLVTLNSSDIPGLEEEINAEVVFLREDVAAGDSWTNEGDVRINGIDAKIRLVYTCTEANTTVTVNGKSFPNVYKVVGKVQVGLAGNFADVGEEEAYYAKGIGLIFQQTTGEAGDFEWHIKSWNVE